jgi:Zn-dependent peptidase ImmA (M78 family)/transcriptional regulator with XRE-family HTH domain
VAARVPINSDTLVWARAAVHLDEDDVARAANVSAEQYEKFETGEVEPTLRQARLMAKRLDRSVAFLFAPAPERSDVAEAADFRGRAPGALPSDLFKQMRRADVQRVAFLDLVGSAPETLKPSELDFDNVVDQARAFRGALGLTDDFRPAENQAGAVFNFWRAQLEARGYLVFQTTGIEYDAFRGLSIYHDTLPVILLNGADTPNGKTFSLFHEVAHIANRTSGVCLLQDDVMAEALANRFAADFLMPRSQVIKIARGLGASAAIEALAHDFRVSKYAAAIRLRALNVIDVDQLEEFRQQSDSEWRIAREVLKNKDGFVPLWTTRTRDLGPTYLSAVFEALDSDRLNYLDASYLVGARVPIIERMIDDFRRGGRRDDRRR